MNKITESPQTGQTPNTSMSPAQLAELWAKKYVGALEDYDRAVQSEDPAKVLQKNAEQLRGELRSASARAWTLTESLLSYQVKRHGIKADLIDPWRVSKDVHAVYAKALMAYEREIPPRRLSINISSQLGAIRKYYTSGDPRLIGFVSMQFHHCGQLLVESAPKREQTVLASYFKVIDDHLYMPLQRAYEAAAQYAYDDERLRVVQTLLPHSTTIANSVVDRVQQLYPN